MTSPPDGAVFDVAVVGGGPAGSAAARFLALRNHSVLLLTRSVSRRPGLAESLPPSTRKLFDALEVTARVDEAGFLECRGNTVWWGSPEPRSVPFPDGRGWQVERRKLDGLLLRAAEEAGARIQRDAPVRTVELPGEDGIGEVEGVEEVEGRKGRDEGGRPRRGSEGARGWVHFRTSKDSPRRIGARFVLDCSGRAGVIASRGMRITRGFPPTTGLVGIWRRKGGWGLDDETHTLVESYRDGWAWSIPVSPEVRYFTCMVDPRRTGLEGEDDLEGLYREELRKTGTMARLVAGGEPTGRPWACGATPYRARRLSGAGFLLVGDAAAFIDPLSSFGVKKALASGWLAGVAVNTALRDSDREKLALDFFEAREQVAARSFHAQAGEFYRQGAGAHPHPFWQIRAASSEPDGSGQDPSPPGDPRGTEGHRPSRLPFDDRAPAADGSGSLPSGAPDVVPLRRDPRVLAAFDRLREAPRVCLRAVSDVPGIEGPRIQDGEVVRELRLATPSFPAGLRYLREVDVVHLFRIVDSAPPEEAGVPELHAAYARTAREIPLPDFLGALSVLLAEGVLVNQAPSDFAEDPIPSKERAAAP